MAARIVKTDLSGEVAEIVIENETRLNALTVAMWRDLRATIEALGESPQLRCIVIRGAGEKAFSAGADISEFSQTRTTRDQVVHFHEQVVGPCLKSMADCAVPIVAKIRGACMGGGLEIASLCDLRLGDTTVKTGAPVGRLGFPLAFGETQALFNLVGPTTCAEILLEGRVFSAEEARERRLLTRVVAPQELDAEVDRAVQSIALSGVAASRAHKQQIRRLMADGSPVSYEERLASYAFADTEEYRRGIEAFLARAARRG